MYKNTGIYLTNNSDKHKVINLIVENKLPGLVISNDQTKGALFSTITLKKMLNDELKHDHIIIKTDLNNGLQTMSSGQQRIGLLNYLIARNPAYLILDDVYGNIDQQTQLSINQTFKEISASIQIIQLFYRKQDLLPCIDTVLTMNNTNEVTDFEDTKIFINSKNDPKISKKFILPEQYNTNDIQTDTLIDLRTVSVQYDKKHVLTNINWIVRKGEFWQLVGPNGSGKSTLISLLTGDNPKAYGQNITLFGRKKGSGESIWDIKRQIGYFTPAMIQLFTHVDTIENMIISGLNDSVGLYVQPSDIQKDIAKQWIKMLGISKPDKLFHSLTDGMQRMVMVARAMIKHPPLLILDEPTIELDDENSELFIEMVKAIAAEKKIAIIYVSHRNEDALCPDKIFELMITDKGYTGASKILKNASR
ncbi:MAG TPA: ATP-binding cassette domain-containing protein [Paludibacter sp.]|nr:ATP-binding cassette domain-containing protein [Paludibacter sp.]